MRNSNNPLPSEYRSPDCPRQNQDSTCCILLGCAVFISTFATYGWLDSRTLLMSVLLVDSPSLQLTSLGPLLSPMRSGEKSLLTRQERDRKIDWEVGDDVDTRTLPCFLLSHNISAIALTTSTWKSVHEMHQRVELLIWIAMKERMHIFAPRTQSELLPLTLAYIRRGSSSDYFCVIFDVKAHWMKSISLPKDCRDLNLI